jgi:hypothetical protein
MLLKHLCAWAWCVVCVKLRTHTLWDALVSSIFQSVCLDVDYQLHLNISNTIITGQADVHKMCFNLLCNSCEKILVIDIYLAGYAQDLSRNAFVKHV